MIAVPCNGCTRCCHNDAVRLMPDELNRFLHIPHSNPKFAGHVMLPHKPNGDCVYLGDNGCTIHDDKPYMCRTADCRLIAKRFNYTQARKLAVRNMIRIEVWRRGKELLREPNKPVR